jgi:hypothetical protein
VNLIGSDGTTVESFAGGLGLGEFFVPWLGGSTSVVKKRLRVHGAACGTSCDNFDRYRARLYDTTYTIPRFTNSGTQQTVLLI